MVYPEGADILGTVSEWMDLVFIGIRIKYDQCRSAYDFIIRINNLT